MTGERFSINTGIIEREGRRFILEPILDGNEKLTIKDICELLNEQHETIEQLKEQIKIYEKFLDGNDLDIEWDLFCTADKCEYSDENFDCKDCEYMRWIDD